MNEFPPLDQLLSRSHRNAPSILGLKILITQLGFFQY